LTPKKHRHKRKQQTAKHTQPRNRERECEKLSLFLRERERQRGWVVERNNNNVFPVELVAKQRRGESVVWYNEWTMGKKRVLSYFLFFIFLIINLFDGVFYLVCPMLFKVTKRKTRSNF
jgi:hypothetical protein